MENGRVEELSDFEFVSHDVPIPSSDDDSGCSFREVVCAVLVKHAGAESSGLTVFEVAVEVNTG